MGTMNNSYKLLPKMRQRGKDLQKKILMYPDSDDNWFLQIMNTSCSNQD